MRDRYAEIRTFHQMDTQDNKPSGLTKEQRKRLMDLWNTSKLTKPELQEMRQLQNRMR